jgi:hypothetical protein
MSSFQRSSRRPSTFNFPLHAQPSRYNYYQVLQVEENAEQEEIRAAFRRLAKQLHPDVNNSSDAAGECRTTTSSGCDLAAADCDSIAAPALVFYGIMLCRWYISKGIIMDVQAFVLAAAAAGGGALHLFVLVLCSRQAVQVAQAGS